MLLVIFCQGKKILSSHVTAKAIWKFQKNETLGRYCVTWVQYFFLNLCQKDLTEPLVFENLNRNIYFSHVTLVKCIFVKNQSSIFLKNCIFILYKQPVTFSLFHIRIAQVISFHLISHFMKNGLTCIVILRFEIE